MTQRGLYNASLCMFFCIGVMPWIWQYAGHDPGTLRSLKDGRTAARANVSLHRLPEPWDLCFSSNTRRLIPHVQMDGWRVREGGREGDRTECSLAYILHIYVLYIHTHMYWVSIYWLSHKLTSQHPSSRQRDFVDLKP